MIKKREPDIFNQIHVIPKSEIAQEFSRRNQACTGVERWRFSQCACAEIR